MIEKAIILPMINKPATIYLIGADTFNQIESNKAENSLILQCQLFSNMILAVKRESEPFKFLKWLSFGVGVGVYSPVN